MNQSQRSVLWRYYSAYHQLYGRNAAEKLDLNHRHGRYVIDGKEYRRGQLERAIHELYMKKWGES